MDDLPGAADLAIDFLRINEQLSAGGQRNSALQRLVDLAVTTVPGCDWAAITAWPPNARPRSVTYSADIAHTADHVQYAIGDGPCLSAAADDETVHIADLDNEGRWPQFRAAVRRRTPIRGLLSFRLNAHPDRTALNLYSGRPSAYDRQALTTAAVFAAHARVLLMHVDSATRASQLDQALVTNRQIGTAVGILMHLHKITADDAFALLRTTSQRLNRKIYLVADDVTQTGSLPER
nr:GAF and ANTAR domain-containing protein [uncultured Actinoplanes sp.]